MAEEKKKVNDPSRMWEEALNAVLEDEPETVVVKGRKFKVGDVKKGTLRFITSLQLSNKDSGDPKNTCKSAAALIINNWWGLKSFFGIWWRLKWIWYYYVRQYSDKDLLPLMTVCKKKADLATMAFTLNTTLLTGMKDTSMTKTKEEARRIRAESTLDQLGQQQKNSETSQQADISSESSK